jgi:hypothetical protein
MLNWKAFERKSSCSVQDDRTSYSPVLRILYVLLQWHFKQIVFIQMVLLLYYIAHRWRTLFRYGRILNDVSHT